MTASHVPLPCDRKTLELLRSLSGDPEGPVPLPEIARRIHTKADAVRSILRRLRREGYRFGEGPAGGIRLIARPDVLTPEEVQSKLATRWMGHRLAAFRKVGSTNDVALEMARHGAPEGTVVVTEAQTHGRGRLGRPWSTSPEKGLAFSVVLRPSLQTDEFPLLTLAAAVAVAEAIATTGLCPVIKWPNDVMISGRKVCGILTEMQAEQDRVSFAVIGVGVNINQRSSDFPDGLHLRATSLRSSLGRPFPRVRFLQDLLFRFETIYDWVKRRESVRVLNAWKRWSNILGQQVRITQVDRTFFAQAVHVDEKGGLWVRNDVGIVERLTAGDIEILRLPPHRRRKKAERRTRRS